MGAVVYIIGKSVLWTISAMELLMLIRAILSWFPVDPDHPIIRFLIAVTEFVIAPVRLFLYRFEKLQELPIDISFLVAYFLLAILEGILSRFL